MAKQGLWRVGESGGRGEGGGSAVLKRTVHSPLAPLQVTVLEKGKGL